MSRSFVGQTIPRDPALFYWILGPITIVMILTSLLRHFAMTFLQSGPKPQPAPEMRQTRSLARGVQVRVNGPSVLTPDSFGRRKAYLVGAYQDGAFLADPELKDNPPQSQMPDMDMMMNMMKGQAATMLPQTLIMSWVNAFFSGFVILRLPFPLTPQFKAMLQSGVGTRDLDARWVSSLSWYFLTLFGLQPIYNFLLGSNNGAGQMAQQMAQMNPTMGLMGPEQNPHKSFVAEAENLEVTESCSVLADIEERLLARLGEA